MASSRFRVLLYIGLQLATGPGCGSSTGGDDAGPPVACDAGMKNLGGQCVPHFKECADDEVPLLGGTCKRVGVEECDGGLKAPPDWKCKRIGVEACDGGIKGPPSWTCTRVGPPDKCLTGWAKVSGGWCEPTLPTSFCPAGEMEVLGKSTCQPVGDCGTGTWGKIKTTSATIFVDASYSGSDADGTQSKPYPTIKEALAAAGTGAQIAIAGGTYKENLDISTPSVTLEGRCPELVTVEGQHTTNPAIIIKAKTTGVTVRDLKITGNGPGVGIMGDKAKLERLVVQGCEGPGIWPAGVSVSISDTLVDGNRDVGLYPSSGAEVTLERSVVRDTRVDPATKMAGIGVVVEESKLTVRDSLITENRHDSLQLAGSELLMERTVVRETTPAESTSFLSGHGIVVTADKGNRPSKATLRDVVLHDHTIGLGLRAGSATLERTVIRDSVPGHLTGGPGGGPWAAGMGITAIGLTTRPSLTIKQSVITDSEPTVIGAAIQLANVDATIEQTLIQKTTPISNVQGISGFGIEVRPIIKSSGTTGAAALTLRDSIVASNQAAGVLVRSATATLERVVLRDNVADPSCGCGGAVWGTNAQGSTQPAKLTIKDCLLSKNRAVGIRAEPATVTVERTVVQEGKGEKTSTAESRGYGLLAATADGVHSKVDVSDALFAKNTHAGIVVFPGSSLDLTRAVIRDTEAASDKTLGEGLVLSNDDATGKLELPKAVVKDALLLRNRSVGLMVAGGDLTVERTAVRDTRAQLSDGLGGEALYVFAVRDPGKSSTVKAVECAFARARSEGVYIAGSKVQLERCVVRDTRAVNGGFGAGIGVIRTTYGKQIFRAKLGLKDCLVADNRSAGLFADNATVTIDRSEVRDTAGRSDGLLGDGVVALGADGLLGISRSLVSGSKRAGLFAQKVGGQVASTVFRSNKLAIYVDGADGLDVGEDTAYLDNGNNGVSQGLGLKAAPAPKAPRAFSY